MSANFSFVSLRYRTHWKGECCWEDDAAGGMVSGPPPLNKKISMKNV